VPVGCPKPQINVWADLAAECDAGNAGPAGQRLANPPLAGLAERQRVRVARVGVVGRVHRAVKVPKQGVMQPRPLHLLTPKRCVRHLVVPFETQLALL
jgi:hypothetical protein